MLYDVAIIGGGPAGYTAAERLASAGKKVVLFEKNELGGVCLNEGCIPTKTLLYSAKVYDIAKEAKRYGVTIEGDLSFDLKKIISRKKKIVRKLTAGIRQKMADNKVEVINALAQLTGEDRDKNIQILAGEKEYTAAKVLICAGSETIIPPIQGLNETHYITSKEALDIETLPASLTIIGGGVIGIEFASLFSSLGVKVSVIEMVPEILGAMDKELSALLREEYTKRGVDFYLNAKVVKVSQSEVTIEQKGEQKAIATDKILLSTGRSPSLEALNPQSLHLEAFGRGLKVDATMRTSHVNVYACGDVTGYSLLAHTAIREAEVAANDILCIADHMEYNAIPAVVYTNPEIAGVGMTEEMLKADKIEYRIIKLPMAFAGRFVAENEQMNGVFKLLVSKDEKILGCHILGNPASELIVIAGIAITQGMTVSDLRKIVFPHPTVGEIMREGLF